MERQCCGLQKAAMELSQCYVLLLFSNDFVI